MIKLSPDLLATKLEAITPDKFKEAFSKAIEVKGWLKNRKAYGIAANQLNIPFNFFVINKPHQLSLKTDIFFNPTYEALDKEPIVSVEYCLSYPGKRFNVLRFASIILRYIDARDKKEYSVEIKNLPAIVCQHEIDHVRGWTDIMKENEFLEFSKNNPDKLKISD